MTEITEWGLLTPTGTVLPQPDRATALDALEQIWVNGSRLTLVKRTIVTTTTPWETASTKELLHA